MAGPLRKLTQCLKPLKSQTYEDKEIQKSSPRDSKPTNGKDAVVVGLGWVWVWVWVWVCGRWGVWVGVWVGEGGGEEGEGGGREEEEEGCRISSPPKLQKRLGTNSETSRVSAGKFTVTRHKNRSCKYMEDMYCYNDCIIQHVAVCPRRNQEMNRSS